MAIQRGIFSFSGKLGNVIHYKLNGQKVARGASTEYKLSEASEKSSTDFGSASSAGRLIRNGLATIIKKVTNDKLDSRLNSVLLKVINSGPAELKGRRQVTDGDLALLRGFELNRNTSLDNLMKVKAKTRIEAPDKIHFTLPEIVIKDAFVAPSIATSVVLKFTCCVLDLPAKSGYNIWADDLVIPLDGERLPPGSLEFPIDDTEGKVLVMGMGISFRDSYDNEIMNRKSHAGKLIDAVFIRDGKIVEFQYPEPVKPVAEPEETGQRIAWKFEY